MAETAVIKPEKRKVITANRKMYAKADKQEYVTKETVTPSNSSKEKVIKRQEYKTCGCNKKCDCKPVVKNRIVSLYKDGKTIYDVKGSKTE